jgi:hypothetical protein
VFSAWHALLCIESSGPVWWYCFTLLCFSCQVTGAVGDLTPYFSHPFTTDSRAPRRPAVCQIVLMEFNVIMTLLWAADFPWLCFGSLHAIGQYAYVKCWLVMVADRLLCSAGHTGHKLIAKLQTSLTMCVLLCVLRLRHVTRVMLTPAAVTCAAWMCCIWLCVCFKLSWTYAPWLGRAWLQCPGLIPCSCCT